MPSLPLELFWQSQGASWQDEQGWKIPAAFGSTESEYNQLRQTFALTDQSHRGKIKVTGHERVSFLNRMLTQDISAIPSGSGQRALLLSAQGKCLADFRVFVAHDFVLLDTEPELAAEAIQRLDKFIIADDVVFQDITQTLIHLSINGPRAEDLRTTLETRHAQTSLFSAPQTTSLSGYPAMHLFIPLDQADAAAATVQTLQLKPCGHAAFNKTRLERKVPRFKIDFDETWFLNETGLEETAASGTKGCYPGQEVVARIKTYKKLERRIFL